MTATDPFVISSSDLSSDIFCDLSSDLSSYCYYVPCHCLAVIGYIVCNVSEFAYTYDLIIT